MLSGVSLVLRFAIVMITSSILIWTTLLLALLHLAERRRLRRLARKR